MSSARGSLCNGYGDPNCEFLEPRAPRPARLIVLAISTVPVTTLGQDESPQGHIIARAAGLLALHAQFHRYHHIFVVRYWTLSTLRTF